MGLEPLRAVWAGPDGEGERGRRPFLATESQAGLCPACHAWSDASESCACRGLQDRQTLYQPTKAAGFTGLGAKSVAAGAGHTAVLTGTGEVWTLGWNDNGQVSHIVLHCTSCGWAHAWWKRHVGFVGIWTSNQQPGHDPRLVATYEPRRTPLRDCSWVRATRAARLSPSWWTTRTWRGWR